MPAPNNQHFPAVRAHGSVADAPASVPPCFVGGALTFVAFFCMIGRRQREHTAAPSPPFRALLDSHAASMLTCHFAGPMTYWWLQPRLMAFLLHVCLGPF